MASKMELFITKWRNKTDPRVLSLTILTAFAVLSLFAGQMTKNFKTEKQLAENSYNRSFYDMNGYVKNVEVLLIKQLITNTPAQSTSNLADIWRQSNLAQENLSSLPIDQSALGNTQKFLSQLSDYTYSLMKKSIRGEKITNEEYSKIENLGVLSAKLSNSLTKIYEELNSGRLKWNEVRNLGNKILSEENLEEGYLSVANVGKQFKEYEGLIYDGAFSEHITDINPKGINEEVVSVDTAKEHIKKILVEDKVEYINYVGDSNGKIETYKFECKIKNKDDLIFLDITKKGGKMFLMISDKEVKSVNISIDDAKKIGLEFLNKMGITNMKDTYYITEGNMATINYAYVQDGITIYPDLIKVKVALDNGEVCSAEMQGYIFNHEERKINKPKLTIDEARGRLNENLTIQSQGLAIIPTESKGEVLTYEYKGSIGERNFLIYINTETGIEERIFLIIDTPNGILTM